LGVGTRDEEVMPADELPDFLKERIFRPGKGDFSLGPAFTEKMRETAKLIAEMAPGRYEENEWIASSPTEFSAKVETILARPTVKATVFSLLARANRAKTGNEEKAGS
jgi:hypothetical protein